MKTNIKKTKRECIICEKKYIATEWIESKGVLKGAKIISSVTCSKKCDDKLYTDIEKYGD